MVKTKTYQGWIQLKPHFIINGGTSLTKNQKLSTGNKTIDKKVIERLKKDKTNIKGIFSDILIDDSIPAVKIKSVDYFYDEESNRAYVQLESTAKFDKNILKYIDENIIENGADTWMEGDISIIDSKDVHLTKFAKLLEDRDSVIELGIEMPSYVLFEIDKTNV